MTETLYVADGSVDSDQPTRAPIAVIDFTFTFDAAAGRPVAETQHVSIPLSGEHMIMVQGWYGEGSYEMRNQVLSLDGVMLDAQIEYRAVGIYVTLTIEEAPKDWTEYEKVSLLAAFDDVMMLNEPNLPYRINGGEVMLPERLNYGADGALYVLLPVYPADYASVTSLNMELIAHRIVAANGAAPTDDWKWSFETDGALYDPVVRSDSLASFEIPIPKNN